MNEWRLIQEGEILEEGDQFDRYGGDWCPLPPDYFGTPYNPRRLKTCRRKVEKEVKFNKSKWEVL